jgi:phosphatidylglycerol:prolipoprotein diacylglycerol transferase
MHPVLFHLGSFPVGTYGLILAVAFFAGVALARRQGRMDGLAPSAISDLSIALLIAAVIGAKLLMVIVGLLTPVGQDGAMTFAEVFSMSTLRAGGAIHGGIIAAALVYFWSTRKGQALPMRTTGDALVPGVALGQAIGRLGCFSAGCCYGTDAHVSWAVTFTDPNAALFSGTPLGVPLHPVQIYTMLGNLIVMALLLVARKRRGFEGQILALYFIFEGIQRAVTETWRGDLDRGTWLHISWLSTGRLTALGFAVLGIVLLSVWRKKPAAAAA